MSDMDMDAHSSDFVNRFPFTQCLSGNVPDECKTGNIVCPTLPRTPNDFHVPLPITISGDSDSGCSEATERSPKPPQPPSNPPRSRTSATTAIATTTTTTAAAATTTATATSTTTTRPHRRIPHTIIERRYRDNLNTQIETLRLSLPTLKHAYAHAHAHAYSCSPDMEDSALLPLPLSLPPPPRLPSKALIIATAATYIHELEAERDQARELVLRLQRQVAVGEARRWARCDDCEIVQYLRAVGGGEGGGEGDGGGGAV